MAPQRRLLQVDRRPADPQGAVDRRGPPHDQDIIVCGHTRCGGIAAIEDGVHENYIADWLCIATGAKEAADRIAKERGLSREEKLAVLTEENVKLQIKHLRNLALIKNMHAKGSVPRIHGWLYRVESGSIDVLVDGQGGMKPAAMKPAAPGAGKRGSSATKRRG